MKHLPVPPLRQSLDRYLEAVRPLLDAAEHRRAGQAVAEFATGAGVACQAELLRFADVERAAGRSWLSQAWLSGYLTTREPLPLSTNVGFRIRLPSATVGVERAAEAIHRVASVHLSGLRGEIDQEVSPRGDPIDMRQWQVLAGGMRHPRRGKDVVVDGRPGAAAREIGVLWRGGCLMVPISDAAGRPVPQSSLADALLRIQALPPTDDDAFTHVSYLGSDLAADCLDEMLEDPCNAAIYGRLVHAVFLVHLTDAPADDAQHQERLTFEPGNAWAYKPFTYRVSLSDRFVGVHVEHSAVDGATLRSMVEHMQSVEPSADDHDTAPALALETVAWHLTDPLRTRLAAGIDSYRRRADAHRVRIVGVPVPVNSSVPFRVSDDAVQQLILLFAQLATYGRVRSAYESVDMREYQAGRTDCLRPITTEALAFTRALLNGDATLDLFRAALDAHKREVIARKTGRGFERHLLGLRQMADRLGLAPALFEDASYAALTTDFLSTTSVGDAGQIIRISFAPTSPGGIGVNYTVDDGTYEFCLTYDSERSERIDKFADAIAVGSSRIRHLLATVSQLP